MIENKKTILFVDDDLREVTIENLENEGYFVLPYRNHDEAMQDVRNGLKFDIAVIDRAGITNKESGDEIIRYIKENWEKPVVCISAYDARPNEQCMFIRKPFGGAKGLIKIIRTVL
ncbi:MAG: response regulator [Nanoarchaeota archaeon]|nr:response regulator [Nanoarchaeota archaeon]